MTYLQRKKLAFMSIVNKVKGFVRTVSGIPPLTLPNCVDADSVINYTIEGATGGVGDVTDDGKYKLPIVCSGKNMFNPFGTRDMGWGYSQKVASITFEDGVTTIKSDGSGIANFCYKIPVVVGEKYTITAGSITGGNARIFISKDNQPDNSDYGILSSNGKVTFTPSTNVVYIKAYIVYAATVATFTFKNLQLERGSSKTSYEEYKTPATTNIYLNAPLTEGEVINYKEDNLPILPTVQGTTIYTVDTAILPSNMEITYYATAKE